jgi:hypothetical protein
MLFVAQQLLRPTDESRRFIEFPTSNGTSALLLRSAESFL